MTRFSLCYHRLLVSPKQLERPRVGAKCFRPFAERLEDRTLLSFSAPVFYAVEEAPRAGAVADFNRDGALDLATVSFYTNAGSSKVSLLFGNGDGTFQPAVHLTVPGGNFWTALAVDVNGDGAADLALSNDVLRGVTLLLGDGKGGFQLVGTSPIPPTGPTGLTAGDYNEDGVLDLVSANSTSESFSVLRGNGDGTFRPAVNYRSGGYPYEAATDDFNNDGHLDLVVMDALFSGFNRFLGNGDGTFRAAVSYPPVHPRTADILTGDFDEDGNRDVVLADTYRGNTLTLYRGFGNGTFYPPTTTPAGNETLDVAVGDFDCDGHEDLVSLHQNTGTIGVHFGNGNGAFRAMQSHPAAVHGTALITNIVVGDFNGDLFPDLAVTNQRANVIAVLLNQPATDYLHIDAPASWLTEVPFSITVSARTILDTVAVGYRGTVRFESSDPRAPLPANYTFTATDAGVRQFTVTLQTLGEQTITVRDTVTGALVATTTVNVTSPALFYPAVNYGAENRPTWVAAGDWDEDSILDLAVANQGSNSVSSLRGMGDGTFRSTGQYVTGSGAGTVAAADVNGDDHLDLVVANYSGNSVSILLGTGKGSFALRGSFTTGSGPNGVAISDFNGDRFADVATANVFSGNVTVLLGRGDGSFGPPVAYPTGQFARDVITGDFNRDGNLDLAVPNQAPSNVSVLLGNGDGTFRNAVSYTVGDYATAIAAHDLDGDGVLDLVTANYWGQSTSVLLGNADGTFRPAVTYALVGQPHSVTVADFDGNGIPDLALANHGANRVTVFLGSGGGVFEPPLYFAVGSGPYSIVTGDFNGDGAPDLATANGGSNNVSILLNKPVESFYVYPDSGSVTAGAPFDLYVLALDRSFQLVPRYTGQIGFWTTDPLATVPDYYRFRPSDQGIAFFPGGVTLRTPGTQWVVVFDTATFQVVGYAVFEVQGAGPGGAPGAGGAGSGAASVLAALFATPPLPQPESPRPPVKRSLADRRFVDQAFAVRTVEEPRRLGLPPHLRGTVKAWPAILDRVVRAEEFGS